MLTRVRVDEVAIVSMNARRIRKDSGSVEQLADRCRAALAVLYSDSVAASHGGDPHQALSACLRYLIRLVALLAAAERIPESRATARPVREAAEILRNCAEKCGKGSVAAFERSACAARDLGAPNLLAKCEGWSVSDETFNKVARLLLLPHPEAPFEPIFFQTMPLSWLGHVYESMLDYGPDEQGRGLERNRAGRKRSGVYFTPPCLVSYVVENVLEPITDGLGGCLDRASSESGAPMPTILDPAMGSGYFLCRAIDLLSLGGYSSGGWDAHELRAQAAARCVYGLDIDPTAVEIARFCVWGASGFADGIVPSINSHLICANALGAGEDGARFDWAASFPEVLKREEPRGFDAVVGNPPYIASKSGFNRSGYRIAEAGQSDSYLVFLSSALENGLVKPGGMLSMVLPDPMLVRGNAAEVRRKLMCEWDLVSLLHIVGAFPEAGVACIVPVCRRARATASVFTVSRIERAADRSNFALHPRRTAQALAHTVRRQTVISQPRCELLYLLEEGSFGQIIRRIHGERVSLSDFRPPFVPLRDLNVRSIYRGEEIGKSAIDRETGELPILLGGQSIRPYEIAWEGRRIDRSELKKPVDRYLRTKILLQKSSPRLIAALDQPGRRHPGYVFPQSVYGIELRRPGMHEIYLLCILNSEVMNEYIRRTATGYKLLQPQIELEDVKALPIRRVSFTTPPAERQADLVRAVRIFEDESLRCSDSAPFPELANFVTMCLTANPEKSDVVHDLLVHLGRLVIDLARTSRKSPDPAATRRLEAARQAIDSVVWRLYSSEPAQMALPF